MLPMLVTAELFAGGRLHTVHKCSWQDNRSGIADQPLFHNGIEPDPQRTDGIHKRTFQSYQRPTPQTLRLPRRSSHKGTRIGRYQVSAIHPTSTTGLPTGPKDPFASLSLTGHKIPVIINWNLVHELRVIDCR